ncbi:hypothetical protein GQ44DRAFT_683881 [Phaeosphaeriaceae sp. PMI808]|nr:hypothetical protein GQ44DRAFT_683881 [Phaeosphaeriaceae sp. PMI808]
MSVPIEPLRRIKCTYDNCFELFDTVVVMKNHKRYSDEHDYCHKCDEDFADYEAYAFHKVSRPDKHNKACRVCGDEFKSLSGLNRHIELNHKVNQKLICIGCQKSFQRASHYTKHLEFGNCSVISTSQFHSHIVHKNLIEELHHREEALARFEQKQSRYDAAVDCEVEGGIKLEDTIFEDAEDDIVEFKAIRPDTPPDAPLIPAAAMAYPPLQSQVGHANEKEAQFDLSMNVGHMSLNSDSKASTIKSSFASQGSTTEPDKSQVKVWGRREGRSINSVLFPDAKPALTPSEFSIAVHDDRKEQEGRFNIKNTHFWDPSSRDFNLESFFDAVTSQYSCPFWCEQTFLILNDLKVHIKEDHRIARVKCPKCLKYFKSVTDLINHCESADLNCQINKASDFGEFLDRMSGGFLGVRERVRPDHLYNPAVKVKNKQTDREEFYQPPTATYLQYEATKPLVWKESDMAVKIIGGASMIEKRKL